MRTMEPNWGQSLVLALFETRGLNPVVESIQGVLGEQVGTRNTFAKLQRMSSPEEMSNKDLYRAWLLLLAIGEEPEDWDIPAPDMQSAIVKMTRAGLSPVSDSNRRPPLYIVDGSALEYAWPAEAPKRKLA